MHLTAIAAPADIAEEVDQVGGLRLAPAVLVHAVRRDIGRDIAALHTVLQLGLVLAERAAKQIEFAAVVGEAVLHLHRDGPAERVEPEDRVRALDVDPVDRDAGEQVPVDGIAERLVEPRTVDVDGEPLRVTLQRRGLKAVIDQGRLIPVAGRVVEGDAGRRFIERA